MKKFLITVRAFDFYVLMCQINYNIYMYFAYDIDLR